MNATDYILLKIDLGCLIIIIYYQQDTLGMYQGKLELEFEILTEEEANLRPAGKGREEPNQNPKLDPPNRPKTSFAWFTSPWNSFKYIIWKEHKCKIIWAIIAILCLIPIIAVLLQPQTLSIATLVENQHFVASSMTCSQECIIINYSNVQL